MSNGHRVVRDPADPNRCKGATAEGQCMNEAEYGCEYCAMHGGRSTEAAEGKRMYHLSVAAQQARLAQLSEHESVKSLREEIALARMLIERRFNAIKTEIDLLNACGPLNQLLLTVERLVKSAHALEQNLGLLLDKASIIQLGQHISRIIIEELEGIEDYELLVDRILNRLFPTITAANNPHAPTPLLLSDSSG